MEKRRDEDDKMYREVWKTVEAKVGKIRVTKTKERREEREREKEMRRKGAEEEIKKKKEEKTKKKNNGSKEGSKGVKDLG